MLLFEINKDCVKHNALYDDNYQAHLAFRHGTGKLGGYRKTSNTVWSVSLPLGCTPSHPDLTVLPYLLISHETLPGVCYEYVWQFLYAHSLMHSICNAIYWIESLHFTFEMYVY